MKVILASALCGLLMISGGLGQPFQFPLQLPRCPQGSIVVIYQIKWSEKQTNLRPHLESLGVRFPKDGYAIRLPKTDFAIVATTPKEQNRIGPMAGNRMKILSFEASSTAGRAFGE